MSREVARTVLRIEAEAIERLIDRLDERFDQALDLMVKCRGRVVVSGMGKSGLVGRKVAATLSSTGTPAYFLHPAEAVHGDLGILVAGDVVLALSHSGETPEILRLLEFVRRLDLRLVAFVGEMASTLARHADIAIDVGIAREACPLGLAPSASTAALMAMGDALALALADRKGFTAADFARRHPGGRLGFRMLRVRDLMRTGEGIPRVQASSSTDAAVAEITRAGIGMTTVVDEASRIEAVLTDGDLRRLLELGHGALPAALSACLDVLRPTRRIPHPRTIVAEESAAKALALLEEWRITVLVVVDGTERVEGVLHLHDLWRIQLF